MQAIIKAMQTLAEQSSKVYRGKGDFAEFRIQFHSGLSKAEIRQVIQPYGVQLPEDYQELLSFSNGISFFEYADDRIFSLSQALEVTRLDWELHPEHKAAKLLQIAACSEDSIYLKCDGSARNIFVSEEGIADVRPLNMSFSAFFDAGLISGFSYFWLWGTENCDLY